MNWLDILILLISAVLLLMGWKTGLFRALSLVGGLALGLLLAANISGAVADLITDSVGSDATATVIAYIAVLLTVIVSAQIAGRMMRGLFKVLLLGWADGLGGAAMGASAGFILGGALIAVLARLTFLVPDNVSQAIGPIDVRDRLKGSLTGSALVPIYINLIDALPASAFGFVPGDFKASLEELDHLLESAEEPPEAADARG